MIKLSQRLQAIADMVPAGVKVADIGTDHGFLPCYLAQSGKAEQVIACDVNAQPLALAQKNIADYNVADKVSTRLGDGLAVIKPGEVDVVTIAGMGGALMIDILDASPLVVDRLKRIVLQPNVGAEAVRIWAEKNRWQIVAEELVKENDIPIIGVIEPGARAAIEVTKSKKIGVIGTEATIRSKMYDKIIQGLDSEAEVIGKACPLFVPLVEEGFAKHSVTGEIIDFYLKSFS